jgi:hypothetical protein
MAGRRILPVGGPIWREPARTSIGPAFEPSAASRERVK